MNRSEIIEILRGIVRRRRIEHPTETKWGRPLVAFAAADDPLFGQFKRMVSPTHAMPHDLLGSARTVVVFYLPFDESIADSNISGKSASEQWARAYIETNAMIVDICTHMKERIEADGAAAVAVTPATHNFDPQKLISDWSHRHVAVAAGLGTLGINNMLITDSGCCGRLGSFVTSLDLQPDARCEQETCLYRHNRSCGWCVKRCVGEALFEDRFDRGKCYDICRANEEMHKQIGAADVCGKCVVDVPCAFANPVKKLAARARN